MANVPNRWASLLRTLLAQFPIAPGGAPRHSQDFRGPKLRPLAVGFRLGAPSRPRQRHSMVERDLPYFDLIPIHWESLVSPLM